MAALSTPRIRDSKIKPGCHKYKPPVRGLAYRGSAEGMAYQNRTKGLKEKETDQMIHLEDGSLKGEAYDKAVAEAMAKAKANVDGPSSGAAPPLKAAGGKARVVSGAGAPQAASDARYPHVASGAHGPRVASGAGGPRPPRAASGAGGHSRPHA